MKSKVKRNIIFSVFIILIFEIITSTLFSVKATSLNDSNYSKKNSNYNYNDDYFNNDDDNDVFNYYNDLYGYAIESYNVDINVSNDNSYDIKETIVAYFSKEKHGIIRNIPTRNTVTRTDGSTNTNRAKITNVNVSEKYSLSREADEVKLKIGDADTVLTGRHTYQISYTYNIGNDKLKDADEFYLNLIGNQWDTYINKLTFTIKMPKDFDTDKIGFSVGNYGKSGVLDDGYFNYSVNNNVIKGTYTHEETAKTVYYPIEINREATTDGKVNYTEGSTSDAGNGVVAPNRQYSVNVTITGEGQDKETFTEEADPNGGKYNVKVTVDVAPWITEIVQNVKF